MFNPFKFISDAVDAQIRYHRILRELSNLTDRELSDIGLNRYEIAQIAAEESAKHWYSKALPSM
jgi:uncharacterized protein YjiS (DUF1127 family)